MLKISELNLYLFFLLCQLILREPPEAIGLSLGGDIHAIGEGMMEICEIPYFCCLSCLLDLFNFPGGPVAIQEI